MSNKKLSPLQQKVHALLSKKPDSDVNINAMYVAAYGAGDFNRVSRWPSRQVQQRMGPLISRINAKLTGEAIKPGELKRTYRLVTLPKAK